MAVEGESEVSSAGKTYGYIDAVTHAPEKRQRSAAVQDAGAPSRVVDDLIKFRLVTNYPAME
jgi:hypothetical protein